MNNATIQIASTVANKKIDLRSLQLKLDKLGIDYLQEKRDIHDVNAYLRSWENKRLEELENLKTLPRGLTLCRPATVDERVAYGLRGTATYMAFIDEEGDFASGFDS